jgi:hypothetical protein
MALFDDVLGGGNWVTGLAIGAGAVVVLPLVSVVRVFGTAGQIN